MAKSRKLIIGLDGTWNDTDSTATNVQKLLDACSKSKRNSQIVHYEEGVGTAFLEALSGGIYGEGLEEQILGAYRFLRNRYNDTSWERDENKVFIFGFSRGAYAARRLAGLITQCGVPADESDITLAWQLYIRRDTASTEELKQQGRLFGIQVKMLGVWDTVKTTTDDDFNDLKLPACVVKGYHAMAIDEKRTFFPVLKWDVEERVYQVWFPGVHSDVGGGYEKCELSDITLQWMIDRAYENGIIFKASAIRKLQKDPCGIIHESYEGKWLPLGTNARIIGDLEKVHISTKERMEGRAGYNPPNLPPKPDYVT